MSTKTLTESKTKSYKKVQELESLASILSEKRTEGAKIAHCHGVFDLLHIGHIRHFEAAKKKADLLIVTVTPDRYVNKGPHRPAFTETLRVEAIAALDSVDYVALNHWPTAVEAIQLLKPHWYVKGSDYKNAAEDFTEGITAEEAAVRSVGGELVFTEEITFSSSRLINQHFSSFSKEVTDYLRDFSKRYSAGDVIGAINGSKPLKVLCAGDTIIDEYQYCEAIGKSSKEPMLALKRLSTEKFAGGVLAVANHVANFCDHVGLTTMLGSEHSQENFIRESLKDNINPTFLRRTASPSTVKRRFVESYFFTKMMELYEINDALLDAKDNEDLCRVLEEEVPKYDVVIVADFGHGMLTKEAIAILCEKAAFLAVNAQTNAGNIGYQSVQKYKRADFISMAENEIRMETRDRRGELKTMILDLAEKIDCPRISVTRGKYGCISYNQSEGFFETPALAGQVLDRMGAGDSYFALTALQVARRVPTEVVGFIGNAVGAQAVATVGHRRFIERIPLLKQIESLLKQHA